MHWVVRASNTLKAALAEAETALAGAEAEQHRADGELQEARSYIKGAEERISFDDMSARIREAACGILVGYWQRSVSVGGGRQASPMINPPDKHHKMSWGHGHMQVIVLTSADPGGLRKYV